MDDWPAQIVSRHYLYFLAFDIHQTYTDHAHCGGARVAQ